MKMEPGSSSGASSTSAVPGEPAHSGGSCSLYKLLIIRVIKDDKAGGRARPRGSRSEPHGAVPLVGPQTPSWRLKPADLWNSIKCPCSSSDSDRREKEGNRFGGGGGEEVGVELQQHHTKSFSELPVKSSSRFRTAAALLTCTWLQGQRLEPLQAVSPSVMSVMMSVFYNSPVGAWKQPRPL